MANSSDVDADMPSNQPMFLTFAPGLGPLSESKRQKRKSQVYKVSGVNILNRNSVDSKTALERLQRRRENHNYVERRRRDNINHTITTLSTLIPSAGDDAAKLNKGSVLQMAVDYIRDLQDINAALAAENQSLGGTGYVELPPRERLYHQSQPSTAHHSEDEDEDDLPLSSTAASSPSAAVAGTKRGSRSSSGCHNRCSPAREKRPALGPLSATAASPVALPATSTLLPRPLRPLSSGCAGHTALPPIGAMAPPPRPPAQSVPSSPSFRSYNPVPIRSLDAGRQHQQILQQQQQQAAGSIGTGPSFFSSDVSSIRHHLNPISQAPFPQQAPARVLGTQSLQTTPQMRPVAAHGLAADRSSTGHHVHFTDK
ncbi:hypothetical protein H4R19_000734 [Coemansia spiralis]|nr:hypothetical protein H4R19_000734 [Coemansia spiralis]